jgi:hypothetical protein
MSEESKEDDYRFQPDEPLRPARPITPITPFLALPDNDEIVAVRVIGVRPSADDPEVFEFVVIKQGSDGEAGLRPRNRFHVT